MTADPAAPGPAAAAPTIRLTHGDATDAEIAAVVAVLLTRGGPGAPDEPLQRSQWRNRSRNIRPAIGPGPGAWRASGLPR